MTTLEEIDGNLPLTITDCRRAGYCAKGVKQWFEQHGLDFRDFLKNGTTVEKVRGIGDGLAQRIIMSTYGDQTGG